MACDFCKRFDFSTAKIEVDKYNARILLALCNTKFDTEEQFVFCPKCGEKVKEESLKPRLEFEKDTFGELLYYINFEKYSHKCYIQRCQVELYDNKGVNLISLYIFRPGTDFDVAIKAFNNYIHCKIKSYTEDSNEEFACGIYKVILQ